MKTVISITATEIAEAVTSYILDHVEAGYKYDFDDINLSFGSDQGEVSNLVCKLHAEVKLKKEEKDNG